VLPLLTVLCGFYRYLNALNVSAKSRQLTELVTVIEAFLSGYRYVPILSPNLAPGAGYKEPK
jgi:hypothetical protein